MADVSFDAELFFGNSDSDCDFEEFEGFDEQDIRDVQPGQLPEYDANQFEGDRESPGDMLANWSSSVVEPLVPPFVAESGLCVDLEIDSVPLDYFSLFLNDGDMDHIAFETNRYFAQQRAKKQPSRFSRMNSWYDTTGPEIRKFLGMTIVMGLIDKPALSNYWSTDKLVCTPEFSHMMPRDRFLSLLSFLHLADNTTAPTREQEGFDPLYKVRPIYDVVTARFRNTYTPDHNIVVDEGMVPWKGRLRFRQYIPNKPDRFGVKLYVLSESKSGYMCDFDIYTGADYDPDPNAEDSELTLGHSYGVVMCCAMLHEVSHSCELQD